MNDLLGKEKPWAGGEKAGIETLRRSDIKESRASKGMSKSARVAVGISDLLNLRTLLSSRSEKETGKREESLAAVLNGNLKGILLVVYSKTETW